MKIFPYFLLFFIFLSIDTTCAQTNVIKVNQAESSIYGLEGVFYSLPQTVVKVDISVNKIQKVKGPYAEYAEQMLGLNKVTRINSMEYELQDIKLSILSEPDPDQLYFITIPEKAKDREPILLFLSEDGVLTGANWMDISEKQKDNNSIVFNNNNSEIAEVAIPNTIERMDTVVKRISLDTTIIEQKFFKKTTAAKSTEQKAREAADFILKMDENMLNLITGYQEVNYDKGTMEFMYGRMNSMKNDYLELFKGLKQVTQETVTYYYIPKNDNLLSTLCRFSISKGIMPATSNTGDLIQIKTSPYAAGELGKITEMVGASNKKKQGVYYRIPSRADISVQMGGLKIIESRFIVNQLGVTTFLPSGVLKNIQLHHNTGALKSVSIN